MKVFTSYFSNAKRLEAAGVRMIGISLFPPEWFKGISMKQVAPTRALFAAKDLSDEEYEKRFYREVLSRVDVWGFYQMLERFSGGKDVALCCFEKDRKYCHRKLVAEWIEKGLGVEVPEWGREEVKEEPKEPQYTELSLFEGL